MSKKNQELVAQKTTTEVVAAGQELGDWGESNFSTSDVVIPKILLMQGTSKLVQEGKAHVGNVVDSMSASVIGTPDKPFNIVPFYMTKCWTVSQKDPAGKFKYVRKDTWTPANDNQAWEQVIGGETFKFEKTYDFYCLLENDPTLPYVLSMKGTSAKAAKELATQMHVKNKMAGLVPAAKIVKISVERVVKDDNKYAQYKTAVEKDTPKELLQSAYQWFKTVQAGQFKTHEVEDIQNDVPSPSSSIRPELPADEIAF